MNFARAMTPSSYGFPPGFRRATALGLFLVVLSAAGLTVAAPTAAGWLGLVLLAGIGVAASILLVAIWPRVGTRAQDARRIAEAAARANVAWAVTARDGSVIDANELYRRMAGGDILPPDIAFGGDAAAATLYRLTRAAAAFTAHEESFRTAAGQEVLAAVRPLADGHSAWWFTPRLPTGPGNPAESAAPRPRLPSVSFFRDAPFGVAIAGEDGRLAECNTAFADFFGRSGVVAGSVLEELVDFSDRQRLATLLDRADETSAGPIELRSSGQGERLAELYARRLPEADGLRIILFLVDVSEQKALETKFAQSQKMQAVGQLAGGVAHDFNNLLTVIIGNSEFLLMRHPAGDPSFKEINEVHQNALRAATLVGQLLAFSRKQTLQPRVLALREVVAELALMLRRLLREGIELRLEHGVGLWPVNADETQISNAVINLVVNARDAMAKGGTVTISTTNEVVGEAVAQGTGIMPAGEYVRLEVSDTGAGIAKEHIGKIFDPFFTTKPIGQGTGLGLATVYGIVKQTGGFITVESEVDNGTRFRIFLPRHVGEPVHSAEPERAVPRDITGRDTILLVEDEEAVRSFAARALKLRGYQVLEASGGEEALAVVQKYNGSIHLLITDVVMPNMDGPTLVRAVKRIRPEMGVIFMSGYAEEAFRRHDERPEDLHFLPKPFGLKQLAAKVKDVLSRTSAAGGS